MAKKDKSSKRKARDGGLAADNGVNSFVTNQKGLSDKDGVEIVDDLNEPTMGEKLASLVLQENDKATEHEESHLSTLIKPPSADSVHILLKQALRADDRALLVDCLNRQDNKVITNSLSMLNPSDVLMFLKSLVSIAQLRGAVLVRALPWLRNLLLQHSSSIMSQESSLVLLNSLYQLIESRLSTIDHAFQLSSCLDILYAETIDDEEEENETIAPVIFEDNDESDEDGSQDSMEIETVEDDNELEAYSDISAD